MSKLMKLREWLTLPEAARYLSLSISEEVKESELLQLALDGHLQLSVTFPNQATVRFGRFVALEEAEFFEPNFPGIEGKLLRGILAPDGRVIELERKISRIDGTWDLPMIGGERLDVLHALHQMIGGPEVTLINLEGAFITGPDVEVAQIQDRFDRPSTKETGTPIRPFFHPDDYFPAAGLPSDSMLVVKPGELVRLQSKLLDSRAETTVQSRERTTYLNIIGALLECVAGTFPNGKPHPSFGTQAALIETIASRFEGIDGLSKRNLEKHFAAAKRSLNSA